jgi:hypothetical protein
MPNKKKPQIIEEPDVTSYNIETVIKRGTIIIKAIADEEWALTYDADRGLYSALQITLEGKKARRCSGKSLTEVLIFMMIYQRSAGGASYYEKCDASNITRIVERQISTYKTAETRIERTLRDAACYFDMPDGTWQLTLSEFYRNYKNVDKPIYHLSKVRYSNEDPAHLYSGVGLQHCLLSFLLKNAEVIEDPTKFNIVDFEILKEHKARQGEIS